MEVTLTYTDEKGIKQTQSIQPIARVAKQFAISAMMRSAGVSTGYKSTIDAEAGKGR